MAYFTIRAGRMCWKSSVYAGSSLNICFDAANGEKDASVLFRAQGPDFEIAGGAHHHCATTGMALAVDGGMQGLRLRPRPA